MKNNSLITKYLTFLFIVVASMAVSGCSSEQQDAVANNGWRLHNLKGNVSYYKAVSDDGNPLYTALYSFRQDGNVDSYSATGETSYVTYDQNNRLLSEEHKENNTTISTTKYDLNELQGTMKSLCRYSAEDTLLIESKKTVRDDFHTDVTVKSPIIEGEVKFEMTYDKNQHLTSVVVTDEDGQKLSGQFRYNEQGDCTYAENFMIAPEVMTPDIEWNPDFLDSYTGEVNTAKYEYDANGNWTTRTILNSNGETVVRTERKITYFTEDEMTEYNYLMEK